jgi:hypothetical protein
MGLQTIETRSEQGNDLLVDVDDQPKGIAFYRQAIGLQVGRQFRFVRRGKAWRPVGRLFVVEA